MTRAIRSMVGVTLLEVMLVLSIVALIILMSVRYYQATSNASQTEQVIGLIQALTASADNLAMGSAGGYSNATTSNITSLSGSSVLVSPWGGSITISGQSPTSYSITIPNAPAAVCKNVKLKLDPNSKYSSFTCPASGSGSLSYTYNTTL